MSKRLINLIDQNKNDFFDFLDKMVCHKDELCVKGTLLTIFREFKNERSGKSYTEIEEIINRTSESVCINQTIYLEFRDKIGHSRYYLFNLENKYYEEISIAKYLKAKEKFVYPELNNDILTINFGTFYDKFPSASEPKSIGQGVEYLNRYLSSHMFTKSEKLQKALFDFLFVHKYQQQQLILNEKIKDPEQLISAIDKALNLLRKKDPDENYSYFKSDLQDLGFEPGLGNNAGNIIENLEMLDRILLSPDYIALKQFLSKIPMIFNIVIVSPHGFFGQEGVLGKPDTGGQVVYILDQVKALEKEMKLSLEEAGLDAEPKILILSRLIPNAEGTSCNERLEKVFETENSYILRVPFKDPRTEAVMENWISRFEVWPYLEKFANDSHTELLAEFQGRPDFVIGNYSDGNIVAFMLAKKFGVTQCNIAHALEKSKYLYSALYWKDLEQYYNFSVHFTADLIAMNAANFIITSSYQEIAGTEESIGQYESYNHFTMPDLYRVTGGINLFHPKFNIVPPGVNKKIYFPYTNKELRLNDSGKELEDLLFNNSEDPDVVGFLEDPGKIPLFPLARLDKIKNITSLVEWYGQSEELQKIANLILVAGKIDVNQSVDNEEKEQIELMHQLIEKYELHGKIRWIGKLFRKDRTGEVYRIIADHRGIFIQPALFEGFGLTVLEAMRSGLPVFATLYGGPLEIILDEVNGFHIDPMNKEETTQKILTFLLESKKDPKLWDKISEKAIQRVDSAYNWDLYAHNLLSLAKIYGFWKYTSNIDMEELNSYLDVIYHLLYKPRADNLLNK